MDEQSTWWIEAFRRAGTAFGVSGRMGLVLAVCTACQPSSGAQGGSDEAVSDTVHAVEVATIGTLDGSEESLLGDVTSVVADAAGNVYVADRLGSSIRMFHRTGEFVAWIGREGDGPGEFQWPNDLLVADSLLYVRDGNRITVLGAGAGSEVPDSVVLTWPLPWLANLDSRRGRLAGDLYLYPHYTFRRDEPPRFYYHRFGPDGAVLDTLHVPVLANLASNRTAFYRTGPGGGRMVDGLSSAPFAARASWDATSRGTVVASEGTAYEVIEYGEGAQPVATIASRAVPREPVPAQERRDSLSALDARIDSLPVPLEDVENVAAEILSGAIPDSLPAIIGVHVGHGDRIWVQRWPPEGRSNERYYDVLEPDGRPIAIVVVPAPLLETPPPYFGEAEIVGVVQDPMTDVHRVIVFDVSLPSAERR